jgi:hypothetical protein
VQVRAVRACACAVRACVLRVRVLCAFSGEGRSFRAQHADTSSAGQWFRHERQHVERGSILLEVSGLQVEETTRADPDPRVRTRAVPISEDQAQDQWGVSGEGPVGRLRTSGSVSHPAPRKSVVFPG